MISIPGYHLGELLHSGARTCTFRATAEGSGDPVLIKGLRDEQPRPEELRKLRYEFELMRELGGASVLTPDALVRSSNGLAIVLGAFEGETLEAELQRSRDLGQQGLDVDRALRLGASAAAALAEVHSHGVLHKSVQPASLFVASSGPEVHLGGFGAASRLASESGAVVGPASIDGALAYLSPEQTGRMNRSIDRRSDLYSLGAVLYEMLTGGPPFTSDDALELVHCHLARTPEPPHVLVPGVPAALSGITMRLLEKRAEDRYQSARGLRDDLEECSRAWRASGTLDHVSLVSRDVSSELRIPERLYGRESECADLMEAFQRASTGPSEYFTVAGYSGVGKSALVSELHKPIVARRGYFISGKFDQFARDVPYTALTQAFADLVQQILAEPAPRIAAWRERLADALGDSGQIIVDLIPEFELVLGPQAPLLELPPAESQVRFNVVFQRFLRACASEEHPLAIFLDDLQWADLATLQLITRMSVDRGARHMLQIGAYRDNEVDLHHPLLVTIAGLRDGEARFKEITLPPLGVEHLAELLSDTLNESPEDCHGLATLVRSKTDGNPFYVRQFIDALLGHGLLRFDEAAGRWRWEIDRIETESTTENVVDLMIRRVRRLPAGTRAVLELAACVGNRFDLDTLAVVGDRPRLDVAADLWHAVQAGLVKPIGDAYKLLDEDGTQPGPAPEVAYRFLHDRVQQAVDALLDASAREEIHLRIGRLLIDGLDADELEDRLLEIVNHLHRAVARMEDPEERERVAALSLRAGRKAMLSTAYDPAAAYLRTGIDLLRDNTWKEQYELAHALHEECAEAEYMRGEIEAGERLGHAVLANARTALDKVRVYELRIRHFVTQTRMRDACETAVEVLGLLGVSIPKHPTKLSVLASYARIGWRLRGVEPDSLLDLPRMEDPEKLAAMRIMMRVTSAAYQYSLEVYGHVSLMHAATSLAYGNGPHSAYGYATYASLRWYVGDIEGAYRYGKMALELAHRFGLKDQIATITFLYNNFHRHWVEPQRACYQPIIDVRNLFVESGEMEYFAYSLYHPIYDAFFAGVELQSVHGWFESAVETCEHLDLGHARPMAHVGRLMVQNLVGQGPEGRTAARADLSDERYDPEREFTELLRSGHRSAVYYAHLARAICAYAFDDPKEALEHAAEGVKMLDSVLAMVVIPGLLHVQSLASAALAFDATGSERSRFVRTIRKNQARMRKWAKFAPQNFAHKVDLLEAETLALAGKHERAQAAYVRAIEGARSNDFPQEEALGNERAALHFLRRGMNVPAAAHMRQSHAAYVTWGAHEKARALRERYPTCFEGDDGLGSTPRSTQDLDVESVMRASQILSGEIVLDRLLERLVTLVLQAAGAERVVLVRCVSGAATVVAEGDSGGVQLLPDEPLDASTRLPSSLVGYAIRSKDPLVVDDARASAKYSGDAYVMRQQPRSILAVPTLFQGEVTGALYAENNLSPGAFTSERVELLRLLAAQAGTSLQNARLFSELFELNVAYERFVPRAFLRFLSKESIVQVGLGDQVQRDLSVLFADIRSFTSLSERLEPAETFRFLNSYLGRMEPIVLRHGGFIDKFMGDAIMALFEGSPDGAVAAAIEMGLELTRLNDERVAAGEPVIRVGVGVNTGPVMLGTIGGHDRMDGTVIGNTVNVAARLEGLTKSFGAGLLVSDVTRSLLADPTRYRSRRLGGVAVEGKDELVEVHEFYDADPEAVATAKQSTGRLVEQGVTLLQAGDFDGAERALSEARAGLPEDPPVDHLLRLVRERRAGGGA